jgi:hypothetical protein
MVIGAPFAVLVALSTQAQHMKLKLSLDIWPFFLLHL